MAAILFGCPTTTATSKGKFFEPSSALSSQYSLKQTSTTPSIWKNLTSWNLLLIHSTNLTLTLCGLFFCLLNGCVSDSCGCRGGGVFAPYAEFFYYSSEKSTLRMAEFLRKGYRDICHARDILHNTNLLVSLI